MPPSRLPYRRRSSVATSALQHIKAGVYGVQSPSPRSVTFAPNVTPGTYHESDDLASSSSTAEAISTATALFPPSELPANPPTCRRRAPPGKRRSLGYIPRPPNAFMLFRADFVRQKHVPGSIETNHGSLSKIIGNCWRALPLEEKRIWDQKAKQAKAEHAAKYPGYRFRPVHNKNKDKKKEKICATPEDEQRCEAVAQLLLEGKKGDELAAAIRRLDQKHKPSRKPVAPPRRPSSVPLPDTRFNPIMLPSVPFLPGPRAESPVGNISRSTRLAMAQRRPSSALPLGRSWDYTPFAPTVPFHRNELSLPEADTSMFDPLFLDSDFSFHVPSSESCMNFNELFTDVAPHAQSPSDFSIRPLDHLSPQDMSLQTSGAYGASTTPFDIKAHTTWPPMDFSHSQPSSSYSGSPARSDLSLPVAAPQPQHATAPFDAWQESSTSSSTSSSHTPEVQSLSTSAFSHQHQSGSPSEADQNALHLANYATGLESLFDGSFGSVDTGFDYGVPEY
ncbi:hypothetical protein F5I97DRAFT_1807948 [Phlebopus sp. FC_14]|nr:hypothetical protein F5I97DRAFT_1807948 [Phlebopus sp. FC_14]